LRGKRTLDDYGIRGEGFPGGSGESCENPPARGAAAWFFEQLAALRFGLPA
jgi:hypothetical protein